MTEDEGIVLDILKEIESDGVPKSGASIHIEWLLNLDMIDCNDAETKWWTKEESKKFIAFVNGEDKSRAIIDLE